MAGLDSFNDKLLEGTSRSFYLTLKRLPGTVKGQIGLLYLLARISDTIADSGEGNREVLLGLLEDYNSRAQGKSDSLPDLTALSEVQSNPAEASLLLAAHGPLDLLDSSSEVDRGLIRKCLDIIISGQRMDLERFSGGAEGSILALKRYEEMDDYAYRVAGSVGEFWTATCLEHAFEVDPETRDEMMEAGVRFGKALQLINILRDIPEDLGIGRCYIPSEDLMKSGLRPEDLLDPNKMDAFRPLFDTYLERAEEHLQEAVRYILMLPHNQYRLRGACMIPVIIGQRTLRLLRTHNVLEGENRVKVPRKEIKGIIRKVIMSIPSRKLTKSLLSPRS